MNYKNFTIDKRKNILKFLVLNFNLELIANENEKHPRELSGVK
ncbi:hypothetical protein [uncultured Ilyobacter sp.]|nr:hypothetical protein [uncultured Ilyobacter sp.]